MTAPNREILGRLLFMSAATMTLLAVCAWIGVLPVAPESRYLLAIVLGSVAFVEAAIAVILLVRP
jgi:hypothetical protein